MFRKRLVNFLFGDGVLGELITANEQATDDHCSGK